MKTSLKIMGLLVAISLLLVVAIPACAEAPPPVPKPPTSRSNRRKARPSACTISRANGSCSTSIPKI